MMNDPMICPYCSHPFPPIGVTADVAIPARFNVVCGICGAQFYIQRSIISGPTIDATDLVAKRNVNR